METQPRALPGQVAELAEAAPVSAEGVSWAPAPASRS
jgi:hypothetical protein